MNNRRKIISIAIMFWVICLALTHLPIFPTLIIERNLAIQLITKSYMNEIYQKTNELKEIDHIDELIKLRNTHLLNHKYKGVFYQLRFRDKKIIGYPSQNFTYKNNLVMRILLLDFNKENLETYYFPEKNL